MGFWKPGASIIHQIVLENHAFPGGMMVGTDSHTPNAGGMGMIAIGVGGADAVDVMAGLPLELTAPKVLGVRLTGELSKWASPKDIINTIAGMISVKGGTGSIIEYYGPGAQTLSATGMATVCNMGAETGATTSLFPYAPQMADYLRANSQPDMARAVEWISPELHADEGAEYDHVIQIDLSTLEPCINGPFTPDLSTPVSKFGSAVAENKWPDNLTAGLIGSCTNSSFEDMGRAASLAQQALDVGLKPKMPLLVSPGSLQTRETLEKAGILQVFEKLGATMLPNACGPNSIITSYNRNSSGHLDSNPATHVFLASPEVVMGKIFSGDLSFDPSADSIPTSSGAEFRFVPPAGDALPQQGYEDSDSSYKAPPTGDRSQLAAQINPSSERLPKLAPFAPWNGNDYENCLILIKTTGKCTTDHITPAGLWFRYRGHLENISNNTLIGAVNAESGKVNTVRNHDPHRRRHHNYGEGSSREHAALQPRYLGGVAIIAKSFARIHEANLKKQGMLALTFAQEADYDRIRASDLVDIVGLPSLSPGRPLTLHITPSDSREPWKTELRHTFTPEQIEYFRAGSALNLMASKCHLS
ncbi:hypothetical protein NUU61_004871 [Penicillium alfredii]|uniref:Aconitase n=1 Tax=Penicillium alfredii TaxID=1506179 RepID=A0A9W9F8K1_9EURO|nr:uncharacterized protein NUU61_004871 [Penicillium alfredii]KAJ5095515.1 hypothetical protein NUU61_004871 [Penicillium alfredii]